MNLPSFWTQSTTDSLIASVITVSAITLIAKLWSWIREPITRMARATMKKFTANWIAIFSTTADMLVFFFLTWWVHKSITSTAPLTRIAVFEIAFWTFWLLAFAMHWAFFRKRRVLTNLTPALPSSEAKVLAADPGADAQLPPAKPPY